MKRAFLATGVVVFLCGTELAQGQWAKFTNQTSTRLSAAANLGTGNADEKAFAWGDFDLDGDIDLAVVMKQPFTTRGTRRNLLLMNQAGVLTDRTDDYATASDFAGSNGFLDLTNDRDVIVADVNGDGWPDLVTATTLSGNTDGTIGQKYISHPRIYLNRGNDGQWNWLGFKFEFYVNGNTSDHRIPTMPAEPRFCAVTAGDVDNDGDQDLYFADYNNGGPRPVDLNDRLWINDGQGKYTDESIPRMTTQMLTSSFGTSAYFVDVNNDGALDVVRDFPTQISVSYNNINNIGMFNGFQVPYNGAAYEVTVGDLNNDNRIDLIASDDGLDRYLINNGNGSNGQATFTTIPFTYQGSGDDGFASDGQVADLNNDGWRDIIITDVDVDASGCSRRTHIFRNLGNTPNVTMREEMVSSQVAGIPAGELVGCHDVAIFDIDADGWKDLVLGRCTGLRVWMNVPPTGIQFTYPQGQPAYVQPGAQASFQVQLAAVGTGTLLPGSGMMFLSIDGGPFVGSAMPEGPPNIYTATLPAGECLDRYEFYFTGQIQAGNTYSDPAGAPAFAYSLIAAQGEEISLQEGFEADVSGWTVENHASLTAGAWEAVDPNGTIFSGAFAAPEDDASQVTENVKCFVTQNGAPGGAVGAADVDGGPTNLISPLIDLAGSDATISYARWFFSSSPTNRLIVSVSNDDGANWTTVEQVASATEGQTQWHAASFRVSDFVSPSAQVRVRFEVTDPTTTAVTEAGIDNFVITRLVCGPVCACPADVNADLFRDGLDVSGFVNCLLGGGANCGCADVNGGGLDESDVADFVTEILGGNGCQ